MPLPPHVLEGLLLATGFTGALTLVWLARRAAALVRAPLSVAGHLSPGGSTDVLVRELAAARREVLFQAPRLACRPVAQALLDAKLRGAAVQVLLADDAAPSDADFLREQGLPPRVGAAVPRGGLVLIDGRVLLTASFPLAGPLDAELAGQLFVIKGHPDLATACRQAFTEPPAPDAEPPAAPPEPAPAADPLEAVARASLAAATGPDAEPRPKGPITKAAADLLGRLRQETAGAERDEGAGGKAA